MAYDSEQSPAWAAVDRLREAQRLIRAGWCRNSFRVECSDGSTHYCILGALAAANKGQPRVQLLAMNAVSQAIGHRMGRVFGTGSWNDRIARDTADVANLLDEAITLVEDEVGVR